MKTIEKESLMLALLVGMASVAVAQDIYDDIYYNPKTDNKPKQAVTNTQTAVTDYPSADTYNYDSGSSIDVDAYNRRGIFAVDTTTVAADNSSSADFECTRQIERFYNPDVIVESDDPTLAKAYYAEPQSTVNIVINSPGYWGWGYTGYSPYWNWNYPYYSSYWGWNYPYYYGVWGSPYYYASWYGPTWSWTWGWGPGYGGWGPGYGWRPGWGGPAWGWSRPNNPRHPSAWQANRPGYGRPGGGNNTIGQRPGVANPRPGGNYGHGNNTQIDRPGNGTTGVRPGAGMGQRPSANPRPSGNAVNGNANTGRPAVTGTATRPSAGTRPGQLSGGFNTMPATIQQGSSLRYDNHNSTSVRNNPAQRPASTTKQTTTQSRPTTTTYKQSTPSTQNRSSFQHNQQPSRGSYSSPSNGGGNRGSMGGGRSGGGSRGSGGRH